MYFIKKSVARKEKQYKTECHDGKSS